MKAVLAFMLLFSVQATALQVQQRQQQQQAPVSEQIPYYGEEFYRTLGFSRPPGADLKQLLKKILRNFHLRTQGLDQILPSCSGPGCYRHVAVGYKAARVFMMGQYYLVRNGNEYGVRDVYCEKVFHASDFRSRKPGPNQIPDDTILNAEHTWPQSKFTRSYDKEMQKSDVHHLYPTDSKMNSMRGNFPFGEVTQDTARLPCTDGGARLGRTKTGEGPVFQPPAAHRGNVARSLFYFSLRYDMPIDPSQEASLRKWNREDPVDEEELDRNEHIFKLQGSRNPFIDYPDLADRIQDF